MYERYICLIQYRTPKLDKEIKIRADASENTLKMSNLKVTTLQVSAELLLLADLLVHKYV
jgi:hypothetical protein